jgi:hypothetical protein
MSAEEIRHHTEMLERRAKIVRSRLLRAVDALDARRHQVEAITKRAKEVAVPAVVGIVGIGALFAVSALCFGVAIRRRRRLSMRERTAEFVRGLAIEPRPSFARRAIEKVALTLLTYAATEVARRATKNVVDGRLVDGRLAVGKALEAHRTELRTT